MGGSGRGGKTLAVLLGLKSRAVGAASGRSSDDTAFTTPLRWKSKHISMSNRLNRSQTSPAQPLGSGSDSAPNSDSAYLGESTQASTRDSASERVSIPADTPSAPNLSQGTVDVGSAAGKQESRCVDRQWPPGPQSAVAASPVKSKRNGTNRSGKAMGSNSSGKTGSLSCDRDCAASENTADANVLRTARANELHGTKEMALVGKVASQASKSKPWKQGGHGLRRKSTDKDLESQQSEPQKHFRINGKFKIAGEIHRVEAQNSSYNRQASRKSCMSRIATDPGPSRSKWHPRKTGINAIAFHRPVKSFKLESDEPSRNLVTPAAGKGRNPTNALSEPPWLDLDWQIGDELDEELKECMKRGGCGVKLRVPNPPCAIVHPGLSSSVSQNKSVG